MYSRPVLAYEILPLGPGSCPGSCVSAGPAPLLFFLLYSLPWCPENYLLLKAVRFS
jgi:hypothetical protein